MTVAIRVPAAMPRGAEQPQLRHPPIRIYSFLGWAFNVEQVQRLRYLKWIGTYTALALISEVGDFRRFPSTRAFMAFLGLVPSEHSSGGRRRTGGITKTGNSFLRALLIEASWHYAYPKRSSEKLRRKRKGQPGQVAAYAARASERFHRVYRKLSFRRHNGKVAVVAVAWGGEAGL